MQQQAEKQFNSRFSVIPSELFGKDGSARFKNGGKRFTASKILQAGLLGTRQAVLGDGCTTSYTDFENELHYARATTARNVAELTACGAFERKGQSKYEAGYSIDTKNGLPVYHFLRTEEFNGKRLSGNAVLYLSCLIRFYDNPERKQKYFIGGENRAAKVINVPTSTAHGFINELLKSDCIQRFMLHDGKLSEGKGINADYLTVYTVSDKIMKTVKAIRKQLNKQKVDQNAIKKIFADAAQSKATREEKAAKPSQKPRKENLLTQWQSTLALMEARAENRAETLAKAFKNDFTFNELKRDYIATNSKLIDCIKQNPYDDTPEQQELQGRLDKILEDILNFILSHNIRRVELPDDWKGFIISVLRS